MSLLELMQMPIVAIVSWLLLSTKRELLRWSRAAGPGPVPGRQLAAPAEAGRAPATSANAGLMRPWSERGAGSTAAPTPLAAALDRDNLVALHPAPTVTARTAPLPAKSAPFIAGAGAQVYSLDAFRRARREREPGKPHVA